MRVSVSDVPPSMSLRSGNRPGRLDACMSVYLLTHRDVPPEAVWRGWLSVGQRTVQADDLSHGCGLDGLDGYELGYRNGGSGSQCVELREDAGSMLSWGS